MYDCMAQPADTTEIVEQLEDSQMTLASLSANRYATPFREDLTSWLSKLASVSEQVRTPYLLPALLRPFELFAVYAAFI